MTISAKIIADSVSPLGVRLPSVAARYPKFIHDELMTHRVFSRNASSSRAIPVSRLIDDVLSDPVYPAFWGKNQPGMQAADELRGEALFSTQMEWDHARNEAINRARRMANNGAHKQIVNRILEPYSHINTLITSTEWVNFFTLRRHIDAQPEMHALAHAIHDALAASTPTLLQPGEWHLPYVTEDDWSLFPETLLEGVGEPGYEKAIAELAKISTARCARVSYLTHEGKTPSVADDLTLYNRLVGSSPLHASPAEHQATPDTYHGDLADIDFESDVGWDHPKEHGNLTAWRQYRKTIPKEHVADR